MARRGNVSDKKQVRFRVFFNDGTSINVESFEEAKRKKAEDSSVTSFTPIHDPNLTSKENYIDSQKD